MAQLPEPEPAETGVENPETYLEELQQFLENIADEEASAPHDKTGTAMSKQGCTKVTWRAVTVCAHMVPKLDAWAKAVGQDIRLTPLPGCGCYQITTTASAGTHAGGGAIDIDLRGCGPAQCARVELEGRRMLNLCYHRLAIEGLWVAHAHALDPDCPKLSATAAAQFPLYEKGLNALANNGPDTGSRTFVVPTMIEFRKRNKPSVPTLKRGSRGSAVRSLQKSLLHTFPAYAGRIKHPGGGPNDIYGPNTEAVVKEFQRRSKLTVDGVVGPVTWRALAKCGI